MIPARPIDFTAIAKMVAQSQQPELLRQQVDPVREELIKQLASGSSGNGMGLMNAFGGLKPGGPMSIMGMLGGTGQGMGAIGNIIGAFRNAYNNKQMQDKEQMTRGWDAAVFPEQ